MRLHSDRSHRSVHREAAQAPIFPPGACLWSLSWWPPLYFSTVPKYKVIGPPVPTPKIDRCRQDHPSPGKNQLVRFTDKVGKEGGRVGAANCTGWGGALSSGAPLQGCVHSGQHTSQPVPELSARPGCPWMSLPWPWC